MSRMPDPAKPPSPWSPEDPAAVLLTHRRLLGPRLYLHTWVRLGVATAIAVGALFGRYVLGLEDLDVTALLALAICIAAYNSLAWVRTKQHREPDRTAEHYQQLVRMMYAAIVLDFLALTVGLWIVGGARSPFVAFYLLHVIVSCLILSRRAALRLTALAYALLAGLVLLEWTGLLPPQLPAGPIPDSDPIDGTYAVTLLAVYGTLLGMIAFLLLSLTRSVRQGERRVRIANEELGRLSESRRDFLHIAVHNLKSPVGAVTMYLKNMEEGLGGPLTEKQEQWLDRSLKRLEDLGEFMTNMQTLSSLDSEMIRAEFVPVRILPILEELVEEHRDVAEAHEHERTLDVKGTLPPVLGFARLLREALTNYFTNAIKYTPNGGKITVRAARRDSIVRVEVEDSGVGIVDSDRERLFAEFVRVKNEGTEVAKAKGSGLGLSIVRRVVEAHGGSVGVESEPGKGSTFYLELPALEE